MENDGPAVERVRADLAQLGDDASAPDVPHSVTERVVTALRAAPPVRRGRAVRISAAVGVAAVLAAATIGTVMLLRSGSSMSTSPSAEHLTTDPPQVTMPLSDDEIVELIGRRPDLGPLGDPRRRSSCLSGLGYPGSDSVLGGRQVDINGVPAVVLVLAGRHTGHRRRAGGAAELQLGRHRAAGRHPNPPSIALTGNSATYPGVTPIAVRSDHRAERLA